jgi:DNA-binding response OmpR family regulator
MRHVLVVDDNRGLADALALLLEDQGFATRVAYDADRAWKEVQTSCPDVVILDIGLPGMGGAELARKLRVAFQNSIVLLAFTGSILAAEQALLCADFDAVIRKPASLDDIMMAMRTVRPQTC